MTDITSFLTPDDKKERCGLILKDDTVVEVENVHVNPELGFRMNSVEVLNYIEDAKATWHTHPDSDPNLSSEDYAGFLQWPHLEHHIVGWRQGKKTVCSYIVNDGIILAAGGTL